MDENHQDLTPFNSPYAPNDEIRIVMSSVEENTRKLYEAAKMGCIQTLKALIQDDQNLIQKILISASNIESPLHVSVSHGHLEFTRLLLDHKPELAAEVDALQRTPLHIASENGDVETIGALLEKKIVQELINARPQSIWMKLNNNGRTILHLCVESNHLEVIKLLIEILAMNGDKEFHKEFLNTTNDAGNTILDLSLMLRQSEMVEYLLSIPEVKMRTRIVNFTTSNATKRCPKSTIKRRSRNLNRKRPSACLLSNKKTTRWWTLWKKNLKDKGNWVQEVQGTMMLVATVIATVTFQAAINPPGGVWQQDTQFNSINKNYYSNGVNGTIFPAGSAIMTYRRRRLYLIYLLMNTVSFLASVSVILLIISRFPLKNKICGWVLTLTMCAAVAFLAFGYILGVAMVSTNKDATFGNISADIGFAVAILVWYGILILVGLFYVIRFLVWALKGLWRIFTTKLK